MDVYLIEYFVGCLAIAASLDVKPNWFRLGVGIGFILMAHFKWTFFY